MKIEITIDESRISQLVEETIAEQLFNEYNSTVRDGKLGVRYGTEKAVKEYIYSRKEEIIEKCINRATTELVRKGLPKLIERAVE